MPTDKERLDWLESNYFVLYELDSGIGNGSNYCWRVEIDRAMDPMASGTTRAAIAQESE